MFDLGLMLTSQAIRRQLAAMPCELYLVRLIHSVTKRPFPGERLWTATQLASLTTIRFLRVRNREGCDVYLHPYAEDRNAGYILIDLDQAADPAVLSAMRANGHEPCVVLQTSPGHWQAWVQVSSTPLPPAVATAVGRHLAKLYGGDRASTDWCHLGRLAGFTNQKPQRRHGNGYPPWVKVIHTTAGLASHAERLLQAACQQVTAGNSEPHSRVPSALWQRTTPAYPSAAQAQEIYQTWMARWHIAQRFAQPDWSIVDLWVARALLAQGRPCVDVQQILRLGSPGFPRGHSDPADYLRRTLARAFPFPAPGSAVCAAHPTASTAAAETSDCSNFTGEQ